MDTIRIQHLPDPAELQRLGVKTWPIWEKEISKFPWTYGSAETCYLLAGEVVVTPDSGAPVQFGKGDLVTLPAGLSCTWDIKRAVKKHYSYE